MILQMITVDAWWVLGPMVDIRKGTPRPQKRSRFIGPNPGTSSSEGSVLTIFDPPPLVNFSNRIFNFCVWRVNFFRSPFPGPLSLNIIYEGSLIIKYLVVHLPNILCKTYINRNFFVEI